MKLLGNQAALWGAFVVGCLSAVLLLPLIASAINIAEYKDTLSDSAPSAPANHTIEFVVKTAIPAGSQIEITPPDTFEVLSDSGFGIRNVQLRVDGTLRPSAASASPGTDGIEITTGIPGFFRYTLAPDSGISSGARLQFKIGNHSSASLLPSTSFSTSTGTTTSPGDIKPIVNSTTLGRHDAKIEIYNGSLIANTNPLVFLIERVALPNIDTTEEVPPLRFNGAPTSTIGGTTQNVEISLETDEFAVCRYSKTAGIAYAAMAIQFTNSGTLFHTAVAPVVAGTLETFYVRCIDDEGNFNTDDYLIQFNVNTAPVGTPNDTGDVEGDGTGSGNDGTGSGSGSGGESGDSDGEQPEQGTESGSGGSGGGGGGGSGGSSGSTAGGGFESADGPFQSGDARVIISGYAYPDAEVTILADGQKIDTVESGADGRYTITIDGIARGAYTFGVYATGPDKTKSTTFSTAFTVTGARTSSLSNINVVPSILVTPNPVDPGQIINISGYALPNANITLENSRIKTAIVKTIQAVSDAKGRWSTTLDTAGFSQDTYQIRAKAEQLDGKKTVYSNYTFYGVGQKAQQPINADLNRDGKVNLIDFSILLFWWQSDGGDSDPSADINQDGNVSLTDFSILLFNWTG